MGISLKVLLEYLAEFRKDNIDYYLLCVNATEEEKQDVTKAIIELRKVLNAIDSERT